MEFINPVEILKLENVGAAYINAESIKKAKRKLFVDIELSDNAEYYGRQLTKSDCERVIDELDNENKKEYYYQLATALQPLNSYLASGNDNFFLHPFKQESIYHLSDFIAFINPFFAENFDRSLFKAFKDNDSSLLAAVLKRKGLIDTPDIDTAYKSLSIELRNRITEIDKITQSIESGNSYYTNTSINSVLSIVKRCFPITTLNFLPSYFQSQINKIASSINFLGTAIWNKLDNSQVLYDLIVYLLQLNIDSVAKETFEKNLKIAQRINNERLEQEKYAPILKKYENILLQIEAMIKNADSTITGSVRMNIINTINPSELNRLPALPAFANKVRDTIAISLRVLSVSVWNNFKHTDANINTSISLINIALDINTSADVKYKISNDQKQLTELKKQIELVIAQRKRDEDAKKTTRIVIVIVVIVIIIIAIANSN